MFYIAVIKRGEWDFGAERNKRKSTVNVEESVLRRMLSILICVYYINMCFFFFSLKVYAESIDKFRLVYVEFYAHCCLNGV